jgi:sulfonate transport system substrate-binding protein
VPEDIQRITLTREGVRLGDVSTVSPEAIAYQQALADEFYDLKIIPKKLVISDIVWKGQPS